MFEHVFPIKDKGFSPMAAAAADAATLAAGARRRLQGAWLKIRAKDPHALHMGHGLLLVNASNVLVK
jgi:hypothetical protein